MGGIGFKSASRAEDDIQWLVDAKKYGEWDKIFLYGTKLLSNANNRKSMQKAPENYAYLLEDLFIATLIYGRFDWSKWCYETLRCIFPTTVKYTKFEMLQIMEYEAREEWEAVDENCRRFLAVTNDANAKKRLVAAKMNQGLILDAAQLLNRYLKEHTEDVEAWKQLAAIYISLRRLKYALHCYQEAILLQPTDFHSLVICGELYYSLGEFGTSKDYYAFALILDDKSPRALWGIVMAITAKDGKAGKSGNRSSTGKASSSAVDESTDDKILANAISKLRVLNDGQGARQWNCAVKGLLDTLKQRGRLPKK